VSKRERERERERERGVERKGGMVGIRKWSLSPDGVPVAGACSRLQQPLHCNVHWPEMSSFCVFRIRWYRPRCLFADIVGLGPWRCSACQHNVQRVAHRSKHPCSRGIVDFERVDGTPRQLFDGFSARTSCICSTLARGVVICAAIGFCLSGV
jgi:hypothetical protein